MVEEKENKNRFIANPYIIGIPIEEPEKFFGRKDLFAVIQDNLRQNVQLISLYGQRRIGKSSVLKQIPKNIDRDSQEFIFVNFDCQDATNCSIHELIHKIARAIVEKLKKDKEQIDIPSEEKLKKDIKIFQNQFLFPVYRLLNNAKLILLLDEFDVLIEDETAYKEVISWIQSLLKHDKQLFIIVVVGRHIDKLDTLDTLLSFLKKAPNQEIGFLDKDSTEKQITKPAEGILKYEPEAISAIFQLSAGHPYFTQVICRTLFNVARERDKWTITRTDIESIVNRVFQDDDAHAGLAGFWEGRMLPEQVILSVVAEAQKRAIENHENILEEPLNLLRSYGVITETLTDVPNQLAKYGFLYNAPHRIKIELVYRWLVKNHSLKDEIKELEKIEQDNVNKLLSVADDLRQRGDFQTLQIYEQALALNPNNFTTVKSLAKEYLKVENFDKAFELLMRAYQFYSISNMQEMVLQPLLSLAEEYLKGQNFDKALEIYTLCYKIAPEISKDGLLNVREEYGHYLIIQEKLDQAQEQFQQVLAIAPQRVHSQKKLKEVSVFKNRILPIPESISASESNDSVNVADNNVTPMVPNRRSRISGNIVFRSLLAIATIPILGFGGYQFFRTCPAGQQKNLGFFCIADTSRISRGDRTFFNITNIFRDQGIAAFKQGNYQQAVELFDKAVAANRSDPEVLIYSNNARALQQGSPLTLAVAVPADNRTGNAQEMLRGVAQAQNQFNRNRGLSGRLLEIVIANDSNDPEKAKQVAQELIKDQSILAVIGHNSSEVTQAVLPEYGQAKLAVISPTSTSIFLQNPVFFRAVVSDEAAGKKLAEYTYKNLKLKKVVIFANPKNPYSDGLREVFTKHFERLGGEVVRPPMIDLTLNTFDAEKEVPSSLSKYGAEAAMLFPNVTYTEIGINIAKVNELLKNNPSNTQKRALKLLGGDSLYSDEMLRRGGKAFEGIILSVPWFRGTQKAELFAQQAQQQWGGEISWRTATSYDATKALIKSLSSNASRNTVLENLQNVTLSSNETSGDGLRFTPERERQGEPILVQVKDEKFNNLPEQVMEFK
ncbi:ABC transporter substrate-binding protein [Aulosira sp. FACHB-615]|uniref:ABC transporter substrate-binding protein n=1 Tax=Aulosira sp. FACHB-615 TaxID=2692777 RepID=UPI001683E913|nr:ABC transporter substrate-binding protein [Aulosira sp. FACHB-615]MBD2487472.1 ABC transporter substrate-binding protein [Aulosira sp. FACHB-615]